MTLRGRKPEVRSCEVSPWVLLVVGLRSLTMFSSANQVERKQEWTLPPWRVLGLWQVWNL